MSCPHWIIIFFLQTIKFNLLDHQDWHLKSDEFPRDRVPLDPRLLAAVHYEQRV